MKKTLLSIAAVAFVALMIANVYGQCCGCAPGLTPGFWKHNVGVYLTAQGYDDVHVNGAYSDPTGSTIVSKDTMADFLSGWTNAELYDLYREMCPQLDGTTAAIRNAAANVFNEAAGLNDL